MKTIGLIGGMSWESSAEYYRLINQASKQRLGGHHNVPSLMLTVKVREESRREYQRAIDGFASHEAEGVILGCTEITLLIEPRHSSLPTFDTTRLHAEGAVDWALRETN